MPRLALLTDSGAIKVHARVQYPLLSHEPACESGPVIRIQEGVVDLELEFLSEEGLADFARQVQVVTSSSFPEDVTP